MIEAVGAKVNDGTRKNPSYPPTAIENILTAGRMLFVLTYIASS
jgi:hypothetical protein